MWTTVAKSLEGLTVGEAGGEECGGGTVTNFKLGEIMPLLSLRQMVGLF